MKVGETPPHRRDIRLCREERGSFIGTMQKKNKGSADYRIGLGTDVVYTWFRLAKDFCTFTLIYYKWGKFRLDFSSFFSFGIPRQKERIERVQHVHTRTQQFIEIIYLYLRILEIPKFSYLFLAKFCLIIFLSHDQLKEQLTVAPIIYFWIKCKKAI